MTSRRAFILGSCGVGLGIALAGCGGSSDPASTYPGEFRTIALAAALENQAVGVYRTLLARAHAGQLKLAAPAFVSLAGTCLRQHAEHAAAWNAVLRAGRLPTVTGIPLAGHQSVLRVLTTSVTAGEAAALAYRLETQAAQTYVEAAGTLASPAGVTAAARIAPVEAMHGAILAFLLGEDPAHAAFAATSTAAAASQLTV